MGFQSLHFVCLIFHPIIYTVNYLSVKIKSYLSIVKAVIVNTVAFVKHSAANLCNLHTTSPNGYSVNHSI